MASVVLRPSYVRRASAVRPGARRTPPGPAPSRADGALPRGAVAVSSNCAQSTWFFYFFELAGATNGMACQLSNSSTLVIDAMACRLSNSSTYDPVCVKW